MKRVDPRMIEICAALIIEFVTVEDENGNDVPLVTRDEAKLMTAEQIFSLTQRDHDPIRVETAIALGWTPRQYNHPTNISVKAIKSHRVKTAKKDIPEIAKGDRITAEQAEHRRRMLAKAGEIVVAAKKKFKRRWPKRPMSGGRASPMKRKINGRGVPRT